ncbi:MAG TPA: J domain-containing protein [Candidatus Limnocylindria bacterium]
MEYKDYYEILGVPKTASKADIKKAYRRLARELHPDRNPGDVAAERRFKDANEAHAVLSDPEKRKRYDELGANWQAYQQAGYGSGAATDWAGFGGAPGGTQWTYRTSSAEDLGGFSDFFNSFFGGGAAGQSSPFGGGGFEFVDLSDLGGGTRTRGRPGTRTATAPKLAPVAEATAEVTLDEVARGAERLVNVNGRRLQVKIPPGVSDGSRVRLRGAVDGGDLVINVRVEPDPRFVRDGADLHVELPLTLAEALLGAEVPVPTPTGSVKLRIRPNTQNAQEIHIAGRGLPKRSGGGKGDLVVRTRVVLPKLDEKARADFEKLATKHPQPSPRERMN